MPHLENHVLHNHHLRSDSTLHVIGVVSNPARWNSRYRIAREWIKAMEETKNVKLHIVEMAFGDRYHEIGETGNPNHLLLRSKSEIWLKEAMINIGVRTLLPVDWKYLAWIDMDVFFRDPNWAIETIHHLQHFPVLQPWSQCIDIGPDGNIASTHDSFGHLQQKGLTKANWMSRADNPAGYGIADPYGHTGYAWACTRAFWEQVCGLMDFPILGSADHHMARAMVGRVVTTIHNGMTMSFFRKCKEWEDRAVRVTNNQVGYLPGRVEHMWHGSKKNRYYTERWKILVNHKYDPDKDLMRDSQGLPLLVGKPNLEHEIHKYNLSRMEDSSDQ